MLSPKNEFNNNQIIEGNRNAIDGKPNSNRNYYYDDNNNNYNYGDDDDDESKMIYPELKPKVINCNLILKMLSEQNCLRGLSGGLSGFDGQEAKRLAQLNQLNYNHITEIRLEFQNIIKIDHLWILKNLQKLSLKFNKIEIIENLDKLSQLLELDLSFNKIDRIGNLQHLKQLEILSLYSNCIERLENLDELENLKILSVGNNQLHSFDGTERLRFLRNLHSLNLEGNPIAVRDTIEFRKYIVTFLPTIKYYNYKIITDDERKIGQLQYKVELEQLEQMEAGELAERQRLAKELADEKRLSSSFVEFLNEHQLFDSLFMDGISETTADQDGQCILSVNQFDCKELIEDYRSKIFELTQQIYKLGLEKHEQRLQEIQMFNKSIIMGTEQAQKIGIEIVNNFLIEKENYFVKTKDTLIKMESIGGTTNERTSPTNNIEHASTEMEYNQLCDEYQQLEIGFFNKIDYIWQILMENEVQLTERIEESNTQFGHTIQEMLNEFLEQIQMVFVQMRSEESTYSDSLYEMFSRFIADKAAANDLHDLPDKLKECLDDKDIIVNLIAGSRDNHIQKFDNREDRLITRARNWANDLIAEMNSNETNRNRAKVMEINYFLEQQRTAFDQLKQEVMDELEDNPIV